MININNIDRITLFWYVVIFISTLYTFSKINISLSVVYGTFIILLFLYFANENYVRTKNTSNDILKIKQETLFPKSQSINNYDDIVNFLFSIQDFYIYNPPAYEDMIESLNHFFILYEEILNNNELAGKHYDVLIDKVKIILNSLQSIIYNFPINVEYTKKLNYSVFVLQSILNKYLENIIKINENNIYKYGYNIKTRIITNEKVVPYNTFSNKDNFELY